MVAAIESPTKGKPRGDLSLLDRAIAYMSPAWGDRRARNRAMLGYRRGMANRMDRLWGDGNSYGSGATSLDGNTETLRARAQDLDQNNAVANGLLDRCTDNVIGQGIKPKAKTNHKGWNKQADELFAEWAYGGADARRMASFWRMQRLMFRSYLRDGDAGAILLTDGSLQAIEADDIWSPFGKASQKSGGRTVVDGVELNRLMRPTAFYVTDIADANGMGARKATRIDQRHFVYMANRRTLSQTRGEPAFAQTAGYLDQIDGHIEAVLAAAQMAAMFGLIIKRSAGPIIPGLPNTTDSQGNAAKKLEMEPGMIANLDVGDEVDQITPMQPAQNFGEFLATMLRLVGLPMGVPLELIFLDFSKTNYSSARASLLQAYRRFRVMQNDFGPYISRIYRWRISKWIKEGKLTPRHDAFRHDLLFPGWDWVDPEKEGKGYMLGLDGGWGSLAEIAASRGSDWRDVFERRKEEIELAAKIGLPRVHSNATRDPGSPPVPEPPEKKTKGDDDE